MCCPIVCDGKSYGVIGLIAFNEEHRKMLKRNLLDGRTYEQLAEEFDCSREKIARLISKLQDKLFKKI